MATAYPTVILYSSSNSMSFSSTPSYFPMMMPPSPSSPLPFYLNETALVAFGEGLLTDPKGTILGATGLGVGGTVLLVLLAKYFGVASLFGGGKKKSKEDKEATEATETTEATEVEGATVAPPSGGVKGFVVAKLNAVKVFALTLVKNPSKLIALLKNPKEALKELEEVLEAPVDSSTKESVMEQGEADGVEADTMGAEKTQVVQPVPAPAVPRVYIAPPPLPKNYVVKKPQLMNLSSTGPVVVAKPAAKPVAKPMTKPVVKKLDTTIYKDPTSENNTIVNEESIVLSVQDDEDAPVLPEEDQQEMNQQDSTQQQQEVDEVPPGVIPQTTEDQSDTLKIELNKDQWADIQTVLAAMKSQYTVLDQ